MAVWVCVFKEAGKSGLLREQVGFAQELRFRAEAGISVLKVHTIDSVLVGKLKQLMFVGSRSCCCRVQAAL